MAGKQQSFKGNKSYLPSKPCVVCAKEMTWRKSWAKNWGDVKYCSDACRKAAPRMSGKYHEQ
ncbi:MAG: DUF2256 domain-containing protein [Pseudomonadota bacterium]|uniref:DUF2256 domain-containing protein n=1 Tax=Limnobacter alexandrii TaxID=2570352 RepID=UPI001108DD93|nr:DUF2256 domain-containing protein [Limnobacter alexandrii]